MGCSLWNSSGAVLTLCFSGFLVPLKPRTRYLLVLSGAVFIAGAIGFEVLEAYYHYGMNTGEYVKNTHYQVSVILGEVCEVAGLAIFIYALLDYISDNFSPTVSLNIK